MNSQHNDGAVAGDFKHVEVEEGFVTFVFLPPDHNGHNDNAHDEGDDGFPVAPAALWPVENGVVDGEEADDGVQNGEVVGFALGCDTFCAEFLIGVGNGNEGADNADEAEWHVDEEEPGPYAATEEVVSSLQNDAADQGTEGHGGDGNCHGQSDGAVAAGGVFFGVGVSNEGDAGAENHGGAEALQSAEDDEATGAGGESAGQAGEHEDDMPGEEEWAASPEVGDGPYT